MSESKKNLKKTVKDIENVQDKTLMEAVNSAKKPRKRVRKNDIVSLEEAESVYHVSLLAQAVCVVGILTISILAIFEHSFTVPIEVLVGITLFLMAYNNYKLFKRKGMTVIYVTFGILSCWYCWLFWWIIMDDVVFFNSLYDFYGVLLTDKQRLYFEDYYQNNLTLSEMAINYGVSRNAIHKQLKVIIEIMKDYESKLGLVDKVNKILCLVRDDKDLLEKIERVIG